MTKSYKGQAVIASEGLRYKCFEYRRFSMLDQLHWVRGQSIPYRGNEVSCLLKLKLFLDDRWGFHGQLFIYWLSVFFVEFKSYSFC